MGAIDRTSIANKVYELAKEKEAANSTTLSGSVRDRVNQLYQMKKQGVDYKSVLKQQAGSQQRRADAQAKQQEMESFYDRYNALLDSYNETYAGGQQWQSESQRQAWEKTLSDYRTEAASWESWVKQNADIYGSDATQGFDAMWNQLGEMQSGVERAGEVYGQYGSEKEYNKVRDDAKRLETYKGRSPEEIQADISRMEREGAYYENVRLEGDEYRVAYDRAVQDKADAERKLKDAQLSGAPQSVISEYQAEADKASAAVKLLEDEQSVAEERNKYQADIDWLKEYAPQLGYYHGVDQYGYSLADMKPYEILDITPQSEGEQAWIEDYVENVAAQGGYIGVEDWTQAAEAQRAYDNIAPENAEAVIALADDYNNWQMVASTDAGQYQEKRFWENLSQTAAGTGISEDELMEIVQQVQPYVAKVGADEFRASVEKTASELPWWMSTAVTYAVQPIANLQAGAYLMTSEALGGTPTAANPALQAYTFTTGTRGQVAEDLDAKYGSGTASFLYNTVNSTIDSTVNFLLTRGILSAASPWLSALGEKGAKTATWALQNTVSNLVMGSGASAQRFIELKQAGYDDGQAVAGAASAGFIEGLTEAIGGDRLAKALVRGDSFFVELLRQGLSEGVEEVGSNELNGLVNWLAYGEDSAPFIRKVIGLFGGYQAAGYDNEEAMQLAFSEAAKENWESFLSGALSGMLQFGGGAGVQQLGRTAETYSYAKDVKADSGEMAAVNALVEKQKVNAPKLTAGDNIVRVMKTVKAAANEANYNSTKEALRQTGLMLREEMTKNGGEVSDSLIAAINKTTVAESISKVRELSRDEARLLTLTKAEQRELNSKGGRKVVESLKQVAEDGYSVSDRMSRTAIERSFGFAEALEQIHGEATEAAVEAVNHAYRVGKTFNGAAPTLDVILKDERYAAADRAVVKQAWEAGRDFNKEATVTEDGKIELKGASPAAVAVMNEQYSGIADDDGRAEFHSAAPAAYYTGVYYAGTKYGAAQLEEILAEHGDIKDELRAVYEQGAKEKEAAARTVEDGERIATAPAEPRNDTQVSGNDAQEGQMPQRKRGSVRNISAEESEAAGVSTVDTSKLTKRQKAEGKILRSLAKQMGFDVVFFDSMRADGTQAGANGWYSNGTIYIDVNAGYVNDTSMLRTTAHELTHFIQQYNAEAYSKLRDFIVDRYYEADRKAFEAEVKRIIDAQKLGEGAAIDEVVADGCQMMLRDSAAPQMLYEHDAKLYDKVSAWVREWVNKLTEALKKALADVAPNSATARALSQTADTMTELQKLWDEALVGAVENKAKSPTVNSEAVRQYSLRGVSVPTREDLEKKPPIKVVDISAPQTKGSFAERRKRILEKAAEVISKPYLNSDTGVMIFLTEKSYTHAFNNIGELQLNAAEHLPEFVENAVLTHAESATHGSDYTDGVYTFFAAARADGILPVKLKVKEYNYEGQDLPKNIKAYFDRSPQGYAASYDTVVLEVEEIEKSPSGSAKDMNQNDSFLGPDELSSIKVAELLKLVKGDAKKYIPQFSLRDNGAVMTAERIDYLIADSGAGGRRDYARAWITSINPTDFLNMTLGRANQDRDRFDTMPGDYGSTINDYDFIEGGLKKEKRQTPYLAVDINTGEVVGHEGRHRMRALEKIGITYAEIKVEFWDEDGRLVKEKNGFGNPLEIIDSLTIYNQRGTGQSTALNNIIPLNKANKDAILQSYGEAGAGDIQYSMRDPAQMAESMVKSAELQEVVEKQRQIIEELRAQMKPGEGHKVSRPEVRKVARALRLQYQSFVKVDDLTDALETAYNLISDSAEPRWTDYYAAVQNAAQLIIDNDRALGQITPEARAVLNMVRGTKISLTDAQKAEIAYGNDSYNQWRKKYMGSISIAQSGTPLDIQWQEWSASYPGIFKADLTAAEQGVALGAIVDSMKESYASDFGYDTQLAADEVAAAIMDAYFDVPEAMTYADKMQKRIDTMRRENREKLAAVREGYKAKYEAEVKRLSRENKKLSAETARLNLRLEDERKWRREWRVRAATAKAEGSQRLREYRTKRNESDAVKKYRGRVESNVKALIDLMVTNTDKKHVPEALKEPIAQFIEALDLTSKQAREGGELTLKDKDYAQRLNALRAAVATYQANAATGEAEGYLDLPDGFFEMLNTNFDTPVYEMGAAELRLLDRALTILKTAISQSNRLMVNKNYARVSEAAEDTIKDLDGLGAAKDLGWLKGINKLFLWNNATPYYAFRRLGPAGETVFESLQSGWDKLALNAQKVVQDSEKIYTTQEVREWGKDVLEIELSGERKVQMTAAQAMSVYCLAKRQQGLGHLLGGGIKISAIDLGKGKQIVQYDNHTLSIEDLQAITGALTERQIQVADKLQDYMGSVGAEWGNEVSMARFGYKAFGEANYFPITSDPNNLNSLNTDAKSSDMFRLLNLSATKSLVKGANNAVVISNVFDVFAAHMADMAKYNALALPILDMVKWYNYKQRTETGKGQIVTRTLQKSLEKAFGVDQGGKSYAAEYIKQFIKDLNGVSESGRDLGFISTFMGRYKKAAVAANLRVAVQQPMSYARALAVMDAKYLTKGIAGNVGEAVREMRQYSGIAAWKNMGFFDTNIGRDLTEQIKHDETVGDRISDASMILSEKADELTWGTLWKACKAEMADKGHSGNELLEKTAERFRQVVYATQVVDATTTRSHLMRSNSPINKMWTAFMSEPTLTYNMMLDSVLQWHYEKRRGNEKPWRTVGKQMAKAGEAYVINAVLLAMATAVLDAWRDDDDFETFWEKYTDALGGNILDELNPVTKIVVLKDMWDILVEGGSSDRMDTAFLTQTKKAYDVVAEWFNVTFKGADPTATTYYGKMGGYGVVYEVFKAIGGLSGMPFAPASREVASLWNNTVGRLYPNLKLKTYNEKPTAGYEKLYEAMVDGDQDEQRSIIDQLHGKGYDDEAITDGVKAVIKGLYLGGEVSDEEAGDQLVAFCGYSATATGSKGVNYQLDKWSIEDFKMAADMEAAFAAGDGAAAKAAVQEQMKRYGRTESQIRGDITSYFKEDYVNGDTADRQRIRSLMLATGLYKAEDLDKQLTGWLKDAE